METRPEKTADVIAAEAALMNGSITQEQNNTLIKYMEKTNEWALACVGTLDRRRRIVSTMRNSRGEIEWTDNGN